MEKRLYRLEDGKMLCGVCAGIAEYFKLDPTIIRLGFAFFAMSGGGILAYIIAALIMPVKPLELDS